jgi:hypothetical protein
MSLLAQDVSTPGGYLSVINEKIRNVNMTYMAYLSAVSHGKSARKVEKLREKTVNIIYDARTQIMGTVAYKGDKSLRDATVAYLKTCYNVFNEDYHKIVNMEEIAEQSYDAMEAYLLAQEKAGEKLEEANNLRSKTQKEFAQKYNITLLEDKDELDLKVEKSDRVTEYSNKLFLIFFKSNKQEMYLTDAINRKDINGIEQNRNALLNYSNEGLQKLSSIEPFDGDATLMEACRRSLQFYKELAENKISGVTDYMLVEDNFIKTKKKFDATPAAKRTQADVDQFNKTVEEVNVAGKASNKANNEINKERSEVLNNWNKAMEKFIDKHMPYAKR